MEIADITFYQKRQKSEKHKQKTQKEIFDVKETVYF